MGTKILVWYFGRFCREFDDVTSAGKLFHVRSAATGNARSPTVDSRVDGTSNDDVDDDRRRCRQIMGIVHRAAEFAAK